MGTAADTTNTGSWDEFAYDLSQAKEDVENFLFGRHGLGDCPLVLTKSATSEHVKRLRGALHAHMQLQDRTMYPLCVYDGGGSGLRYGLTINPPNIFKPRS